MSDTQQYGDWTDLNATLRSWQYYDARAGMLNGNQTGVWGGLQDNGTSFVGSNSSQMVEPAGGDGFYVIVDPSNANRMVGEYTDGTMYASTDGGHTYSYFVSPTCVGQATLGLTPRSDCDPRARFATPLTMDQQNKNVWLTGGRYVWVTSSGWNTSCTDTACSWRQAFDLGAANAVTALSSTGSGKTIYAAWVGGGGKARMAAESGGSPSADTPTISGEPREPVRGALRLTPGPVFQRATGLMRSSSRSSFSSCDALYRSSASCPLSQNWAEVPNALASRSAVEGVIPRRPLTISFSRT